jgi:tRNA C32,U32 (ribose-2'-O)-methylase TrmJ
METVQEPLNDDSTHVERRGTTGCESCESLREEIHVLRRRLNLARTEITLRANLYEYELHILKGILNQFEHSVNQGGARQA